MVFPRWGTSALGSQGQGQGREAGSRGRTGRTQRRTFGEELRLTALVLFISMEPLLVRPGGERREGQTTVTVTAAHLAQINVTNGGESSGFLSSPQRLQKGRQTSVAAPRIQAAQRKCFLAVRRLGRHGGFPRGLLQPSSVSSPSPCCPAHTLPLASTPAPGGGPNTARGSHAPAPQPQGAPWACPALPDLQSCLPSRSRLLHSSALWPHTWLPASFRGQGPHHVSLGLLAPNTVSHMEQVLS